MTGPQTNAEYLKAMAGLRATMEQRAADTKAQEAEKLKPRDLASFDAHALAKKLRPLIESDGRGYREICLDAGITSPDLTRMMSFQPVSAAKIFAICDWAGLDPRAFYRPPKRAVKHAMFHVATTETAKKALKRKGRA